MRYAKEQKAETRRHILKTAGRKFRESGFDGLGIGALMSQAGLTHGGFYNHFGSKDELAAESFAASLKDTVSWLEAETEKAGGSLSSFLAIYLNSHHLKNVGRGCALAALGSEMARRPTALRAGPNATIDDFVALIERLMPSKDAGCRDAAIAVLALISGGLQLARLQTDKATAESVLNATRTAALQIAGET